MGILKSILQKHRTMAEYHAKIGIALAKEAGEEIARNRREQDARIALTRLQAEVLARDNGLPSPEWEKP